MRRKIKTVTARARLRQGDAEKEQGGRTKHRRISRVYLEQQRREHARQCQGRHATAHQSGGGATRDVVIPGRAVPSDQAVLRIRYNQVSQDYFAVTGTKLIAGRAFSLSLTK
jgi:hypothetical protein